MRRAIPLIGVCLFLAAAAEPAFAQQRLFAWTEREVVELDSRPASLGVVIRRFSLPAFPGASNQDVVSFRGGDFLAWTTQWEGGAVVLLNTQSGVVQRFTFPDFIPVRVIGTDGNARLLVLGSTEARANVVLVADARSGSTRLLPLEGVSPFSARIAYALASDVLFVAKQRGFGADTYHDIDVIQVSTGALLKSLDIWPVSADVLATSEAGTRLFVTEGLNGTFGFDVLSGTQFANNTLDAALGSALRAPALDEHRNRLVVNIESTLTGFGDSVGLSAFSGDSLQFVGKVRVPQLSLPPSTPGSAPFLLEELNVSGLSATVFVLQAVGMNHKLYTSTSTCHESQLIALDAGTGQVRQAVNTTAVLGPGACGADLVRITEPAAPKGLFAHVAGHRVTLNWQPPFGATHYEIEAGLAPGLTNAIVGANDTQLVVDGVPSGTYHLRVRAINTIGKSAPSQDIQVVVP